MESVDHETLPQAATASTVQRRITEYFQSSAFNWKDIYRRRDVSGVIHQERLNIILAWAEQLKLPKNSPVLDAGCGAGLAAVKLAKWGCRVEALDVATAMVDLTRQFAAEAGVENRVNVNLGDIYHLHYPDNAFSLVLAIGVIPWLESPKAAIGELARALLPGGYLLMTADNRWRLIHLADPSQSPLFASTKRLIKRISGHPQRHQTASRPVTAHQHSMREIDDFFSSVGLERVRSKTLGFGSFTFFYREFLPDWLGVRIHRLLQWAASLGVPLLRSTGAQFLLLARKKSD